MTTANTTAPNPETARLAALALAANGRPPEGQP